MKTTTQMRYEGCLLGLTTRDAVGTTVELKPQTPFRR